MSETTRILIIDDRADVRADLRTLLNLVDGAEVVGEAANINDAVHLAGQMQVDVILIDLDVNPRGTGANLLEGCGAIRTICKASPHAAVYALSAHANAETRQAALNAGADAFFVKGQDIQALLEAVIRRPKP